MGPAVNQRVTPGRVLLILALLLAVWLGFVFYPRKKLIPPMTPVAAESKFQIAGLANNPDWDGLPQIFAVWADRAEWKDGRTRFAYWHPVMKMYSYYFEATREGGRLRFREIAEPHEPNYLWDESLGEDCPIRFYRSVSLTLPRIPAPLSFPVENRDLGPPGKPARPDSVAVPAVELKFQPPDIEKKH